MCYQVCVIRGGVLLPLHNGCDAGEMFGFYWKQMELPYLTYQMFSKEGVLLEPVPITIPECAFIHDFAITENYAIFLDLSLIMNAKVCNIYQHEHSQSL
jgi:carotenoid cleavage dioxygenase-like enzyme